MILGKGGKAKKVLLEDPQVKYAIPLIEKTIINHDTRNFRFGLPSKDHVLGKGVIILSPIIIHN